MIRIGALFMTTNRHSTEFQEQALSKARQRGTRSVQDVANDLNMVVSRQTAWRVAAGASLGDTVGALVQPRASAQRDWLCNACAAAHAG